jgi:hypothetical protein
MRSAQIETLRFHATILTADELTRLGDTLLSSMSNKIWFYITASWFICRGRSIALIRHNDAGARVSASAE